MGLTTGCAFTLTAILRTGEAVLVAIALTVAAAAAALAVPASEVNHLGNANLVPLVLATEGVFLAHAGLNCAVFTPLALVRLATRSIAATTAAILWAGTAGFSEAAVPIAAFRGSKAGAALERLDFRGTGDVPVGLTTIGILSTNAVL